MPIIQIKIKINSGKVLESNIGTLSLTPNKFENNSNNKLKQKI